MSFFKNKPVMLTGIVLLCAVLIAAVSHFGSGMPAKIAGFVIAPAEKLVAKIVSPVANFRDNIMNSDDLRAENDALKEELIELQAANRGVDEYIKENERLRELLRLKEEMTDKEIVAAEVISADSDNFSETVTINRGSRDGVEPEDAVISTLGVVGRVSEVGGTWARVTTVFSPKNSLGVRVTRTGDLAVAEGELKLAKDKRLRLGYISGAAELIAGDIIETSGIGGVYPPGITVGKVTEVRMDNSGAVDYAVMESTVDFSRLFEVLEITEWDRKEVEADYVEGTEKPVNEPDSGEISPEDIQSAQG